MSNPPSPPPPGPPPLPPYDPYGQVPMDYYPRSDSAPQLIRLAVIFNYISVGLDVCLFLGTATIGTIFLVGPDIMTNPGDPPAALMGGLYLGLAILALACAIVKYIGTRKLQKAAPNAWGWGLAVGIIGCGQIVCSCCLLQVAPGVYTVIILCFSHVKQHLLRMQEQRLAQEQSSSPLGP